MAYVSDNVMKFFRSSSNQAASPAVPQKLSRRSSGIGEVSRLLNSQEGLCVLDIGSTSANNIRFFTGKGHKNYSEDLLRSSLDPALRIEDSDGNSVIDTKKFLEENLRTRMASSTWCCAGICRITWKRDWSSRPSTVCGRS